MLNGKTFLAIIPARKGSKRLPNKNIMKLKGKPLISHTIDAAIAVDILDKIVVSTDDDRIISIIKEYSIDYIKRPKELSTDTSSSYDVVEHAINNIEKKYDYIVLLQPTSPLRTSIHIHESIQLLHLKKADAVVSVVEVEHPIQWANKLNDNLSMKNFIKKEFMNKRSQELEKYFRLNGAIYVCSTKELLKNKKFLLDERIYAYKMNKEESIDIDEEIDFLLAKILKEKYD